MPLKVSVPTPAPLTVPALRLAVMPPIALVYTARSTPWPPWSVSLPAPPSNVSSPLPPHRLSLPSPPSRVSSPLPPSKRSLPAPPRSTSLPSSPKINVVAGCADELVVLICTDNDGHRFPLRCEWRKQIDGAEFTWGRMKRLVMKFLSAQARIRHMTF